LVPFFFWGWVVHDLHTIAPHQRSRLWLRGMRADAVRGDGIPPPLPASEFPKLELLDLLDFSLPSEDPTELSTASKRASILKYVDRIRADIGNGVAGKLATFDIGRNFDKVWSAQILYDRIPSLRCKGPEIFMVYVPDIDKPAADSLVFRHLHDKERLTLQGHDDRYDQYFSSRNHARSSTGNAFSTFQVAAIVMPMIMDAVITGALGPDGMRRLDKDALYRLAYRRRLRQASTGTVASAVAVPAARDSNKRSRRGPNS
jgi:hypothetical protein